MPEGHNQAVMSLERCKMDREVVVCSALMVLVILGVVAEILLILMHFGVIRIHA